MPITLNKDEQRNMSAVSDALKKIDDDARRDQSVRGDNEIFKDISSKLKELKGDHLDDSFYQNNLGKMLAHVDNLQGLAGNETIRGSSTTDALWEHEMTEVSAMARSYAGTGTAATIGLNGGGLAGFSTPLSNAEKNAASIKSDGITRTAEELAKIPVEKSDFGKAPQTSSFFKIPGAPPIIVEDNAITKQYTIYDRSGNQTDQFNYADADKKGYNLQTGQTLVFSKDGYNSSGILNKTAAEAGLEAVKGNSMAQIANVMTKAVKNNIK